jgi:hypothetical protein
MILSPMILSMITRPRLCAALFSAILLLAGCGSTTSVSGTVTYEGEQVADGWVTFMPTGGQGREAGGKITAGKYRIEQIDPGEKTVQIVGVKEVPFVASSAEMERLSRENPQPEAGRDLVYPADTIPPDAEGNNQKVVVEKGEQTLDFALKKPPQSPAR